MQLFGTDGIRGCANTYPMTAEMALKTGRAVAAYFSQNATAEKIIVGKDTRISGDMLESALAAGITSMGLDVQLTGILPTPGIAHLAAEMGFAAGVVISASHNPFHDNGIKLFNGDGFKLSDQQERRIEALILGETIPGEDSPTPQVGRIFRMEDAAERYIRFLEQTLEKTDQKINFKVVLDCANGATSKVAPKLFEAIGLTAETLFNSPNGKNINDQCGSEHPEQLARQVIAGKADIGLAFDGDGDRLIVVDETGAVLSGDQILTICAHHLKKNGLLKKNQVVSTVMSNMGFKQALKKMGIDHTSTQVGDRYVMEEMLASGAVLGGEDSGHLIFLDYHSTGDGLLAAVRLLEAMAAEGRKLSQLAKMMAVFPQVLINVDVCRKPDLDTLPVIAKSIAAAQTRLAETGRILVRYSGTQPQCRVMVEAPQTEVAQTECRAIAELIRAEIGAN